MNDPDYEDVKALIVRIAGVRPDEITPDARLLHDMGIDGDDAVELFAAFETQFTVDLQPLYQHWARHFGPEGLPLKDGLKFMSGALPIMLIVVFGGVRAGLPEWAVMTLAFAAVVVWVVPLRSWPWKTRPMIGIAVRDLCQAAATGRWPISYSD